MSTPLRTYFNGPNGAVSVLNHLTNERRYYHYDHQGTVQCLTNEQGQVTDRFASDSWGVQVKRTGTSINRNWYVGKSGYYRQPDQELDYVRARYLSPRTGRWLSTDPLALGDQTWYEYAENQPSLAPDPSRVLSIIPITDSCRTLGNCGAAEFSVSWVPPAGKSGWVIQHIKVAGRVTDCGEPPEPVETEPPIGFEYWEAWPVQNGIVGVCVGNTFSGMLPADPHDNYGLEDNPRTKGGWGLHGYVKFYPRQAVRCGPTPNLPGHWLPPPCRVVPYWRINLHCALTQPPGVSDDNSKSHFMVVTWDCCPPPCPPPPPTPAKVVCHP